MRPEGMETIPGVAARKEMLLEEVLDVILKVEEQAIQIENFDGLYDGGNAAVTIRVHCAYLRGLISPCKQ